MRKRVKTGRTIWLRKDGRYETSVERPRKPNGARDKQSVYGKTPEECAERARQALALIRQAYRGTRCLGDGKTRLEDYLAAWFAKLEEKRELTTRTIAGYRRQARLHIVPALGRLRLQAIGVDHVQDFVDGLRELGAGTVHHVRSVLRSALQPLVGRVLVFNPADNIDMPSIRRTDPPHLNVMQHDEFKRLVAGHEHEHLWLTMLYTGLRIGEALGLRWQDVDLAARTLTVNVQLIQVAGEWRLVPPKSEKSRAVLPLADRAVVQLRAEELRQKERRLESGPAWRKSGLVFTTPEGQPIGRQTNRDRLARVLRGSGLPQVTAHGLRHSTATVLLGLGVEMRVIQEIMRHANFQITANTYAHVPSSMAREAVGRMDEGLR